MLLSCSTSSINGLIEKPVKTKPDIVTEMNEKEKFDEKKSAKKKEKILDFTTEGMYVCAQTDLVFYSILSFLWYLY